MCLFSGEANGLAVYRTWRPTMLNRVLPIAFSIVIAGCAQAVEVPESLNLKVPAIDGKEVDLSQYKGKVILFVNVASECGYTAQYRGLQKLYADNKDAGLVIIGVPSNEFGGQEPGKDAEIAKFCDLNYKVTFPLLAKTKVNGADATPIYRYLTAKANGHAGEVKWNFEKFLVGRDGKIVGRFKSDVEPDSAELTKAIKVELEKK